MSDFTVEKLRALRKSYWGRPGLERQSADQKELNRLLSKCSAEQLIEVQEGILRMHQMGYEAAEALGELNRLEEEETKNAKNN